MCFTKALTSAMQPPVWERLRRESREQSKTGAAGTRGADKHFAAAAFADAYAPQ